MLEKCLAKNVSMQLVKPRTVLEAGALIGNGSIPLAGGTELVPLLRDGIVQADTLVELRQALPREIEETRIGAGATLAELEAAEQIPAVLREACRLAASPQLRAMGTIGGNLLQATRCWYWRLKFPCRLHGGDRCHAAEGQHREHAIFANGFCASAHPSDPAAALLALGAVVETTADAYPLASLYRLPDEHNRELVDLPPGELITAISYDRPDASTYLKAMDRQRWSFALVGVAAARFGSEVRLALAGVAPIPWRLDGPEALDRATPLPGNAYKVELARVLVRRALEEIA
jgi:xanthine dehydrogenase YagS FAD-binding subunit